MEKEAIVTVFTPTYNRAGCLQKLYKSLLSQTLDNFCWLIVDDGSTDGTDKIVEQWIKENRVNIKYIYQKNKGKMQAINTGVDYCKTELFLICDSDDRMTKNAIEVVDAAWKTISHRADIAGMVGYMSISNREELFGAESDGRFPAGVETARLKELMKPRVFDTCQIYRTDIMKKNRFPSFEGEKFVPEIAIWEQIDMEYEVLIIREIIEEGEYLESGYTRGGSQTIMNNPMGFCFLFYNNYLYAKKYETYKSVLIECGKVMALATKAKNSLYVDRIPMIHRILALPIYMYALFYYLQYR